MVTALAFHRCGEVDYCSTALRDRFVSYDIPTSEVQGLSKEAVQARKRVRDVHDILKTVTLDTAPAKVRADVLRWNRLGRITMTIVGGRFVVARLSMRGLVVMMIYTRC